MGFKAFLRLKTILDYFGKVKPFLKPSKPFQSHFVSQTTIGKILKDFSFPRKSHFGKKLIELEIKIV